MGEPAAFVLIAAAGGLLTALVALYKARPDKEATITGAASAVATAASTLIDPLQARISTLERQNTELREARSRNEGRILVLEERVERLLDGGEVAATIAMCLVDRATGVITGVNERLLALAGYSNEDELVGLKVEMLVPERFRIAHHGFRHAYSLQPRSMATSMMGDRDKGVMLRRLDGDEVRVWIGLSPINDQVAAAVISTKHPGAPA